MAKGFFRDIDYVHKLNKEEQRWLHGVLLGTHCANRKRIEETTDKEIAKQVWVKAKESRKARYKDLMSQGQRVSTFSQEHFETCLLPYEGEVAMNNIEDALITKIDADRRSSNNFVPYGKSEPLKVGDKVIIAIEGHYLQNKMGVVTNTRRDELFVEAESKKGVVAAYFKANELIRI